MCIRDRDCAQNDKINIYAYSEVQEVKGFVGNFHVKIKKKARHVDTTKSVSYTHLNASRAFTKRRRLW